MGGHFLFDVDNVVTLNTIDLKMTLTFEQASVDCVCYQWWIRDFPAGGCQCQKGYTKLLFGKIQILAKICRKLHEYERIRAESGSRASLVPYR